MSGKPGSGAAVWKELIVGVLFLLLLDSAVFRSGLYSHALEPWSFTGAFWYRVKFEKSRTPSGRQEVFVVGDSRVNEGFSQKIAGTIAEKTNVRFVNGAVSASTLRSWYFLLREVDPEAKRYAAIVLPFPEYADRGFFPEKPDFGRLSLDLKLVATSLRLRDLPDLLQDARTVTEKFKFLQESLFMGLVFRRDVQDLLLHPGRRLKAIRERNQVGAAWAVDYPGRDFALSGIRLVEGVVTVPGDLEVAPDVAKRIAAIGTSRGESVPGHARRYREKWLTKIIERYRGSSTKIIFARLPANPVGELRALPTGGPSYLAAAADQQGVLLLPEERFKTLEKQEFFFDDLHLNKAGRERYSRLLAEEVLKTLGQGI